MPKKFAGNSKQEEAREREASKKKESQQKAAKDAEDSYWANHGEGSKSKGQERKEEEERKRAEAAARKAELKKLQEEEEAAMAKVHKAKSAPAGAQKMTRHQLDAQRDLEAQLKSAELKEKMMQAKRELEPEAYERLVAQVNTNRGSDTDIQATSVEGALAALGLVDAALDEKHPEKRMKAAWKAYEEKMLPQLKLDKPGMKLSQYKDLMWKMWQKAPENPMVQAGRV